VVPRSEWAGTGVEAVGKIIDRDGFNADNEYFIKYELRHPGRAPVSVTRHVIHRRSTLAIDSL
jgi:hypothetical protein